MSAARWVALVLAGLVAALVVVVAFAPASLVDAAAARASLGRVRLADATGSIWRGAGRLVIADPAAGDAQAAVAAGFALPGAITWRLRPLPLLFGLVDASLAIDAMGEPVDISGNPTEMRVGAGRLDLPSVDLARLGSPWNTIRPSAALSLQWQSLAIRRGVLDGRVVAELRDAASAMTPVRPLGSYRIVVNGDGRDVSLSLSTLSGPLRIAGDGNWERRRGLRFVAQAHAEGAERARLQSLLSLIGKREGERTIVRIGG